MCSLEEWLYSKYTNIYVNTLKYDQNTHKHLKHTQIYVTHFNIAKDTQVYTKCTQKTVKHTQILPYTLTQATHTIKNTSKHSQIYLNALQTTKTLIYTQIHAYTLKQPEHTQNLPGCTQISLKQPNTHTQTTSSTAQHTQY